MTDFVSKFYNVRELVLNICTRTLVTANVYLQMVEHRRYLACEKFSACFLNELPSIVEVYAKRVSTPGHRHNAELGSG